MAEHAIDFTILLEKALFETCWAWKSETLLLIQLRKLWPLDQENPALLFSGMVFVPNLWETDPFDAEFAWE